MWYHPVSGRVRCQPLSANGGGLMRLLDFPLAKWTSPAERETESKKCQTDGTFYNILTRKNACFSASVWVQFTTSNKRTENGSWFLFCCHKCLCCRRFLSIDYRILWGKWCSNMYFAKEKVGVPYYKQGAGVWFYASAKTRQSPLFQDKNDASWINTFFKASNNG